MTIFRRAVQQLIARLLNRIIAIILLSYKTIKIRRSMNEAKTYRDYEDLGLILDKLQGKDKWKEEKSCHLYDWERIESRLNNMRNLREKMDIEGLVHCLRQDL